MGDLAQMGDLIFIISYMALCVTSVLPFIWVIYDPEEEIEGMQVKHDPGESYIHFHIHFQQIVNALSDE